MITRRTFIYSTTLLAGGTLVGYASSNSDTNTTNEDTGWYMPDEGEAHARTWMSFVANDYIWEKTQIPIVLEDLARIARTIAKYEPVSILVSSQDKALAKQLIGNKHNYPISFILFATDDLWLRDTGPSFVVNTKREKACVNFNFNGWGNDQEHTLDSNVANFIAQQTSTPVINTDLILEGQIMSLILSLIIIVVLISIMFKNIKIGLISSVPIILTAGISFGVMGFLDIPLSTTTALLSSIAIGIGIDYAVHFLEQYRHNAMNTDDKMVAAQKTMAHSGRAIIYNAIVVIAGFLVLLFSVFPPNRELGALVSLNMFTSLVGTLTIMLVLLYTTNVYFKDKKN